MGSEPPGKLSQIELGIRPVVVPIFNLTKEEIDYLINEVDELNEEPGDSDTEMSGHKVEYDINRVQTMSATGDNRYQAFEELCLSLRAQGIAESLELDITEMLEDKAGIDPFAQESKKIETVENETRNHRVEVINHREEDSPELDFETQMYQLSRLDDDSPEFAEVVDYNAYEQIVEVQMILPDESIGKVEYNIPKSQDDPFVEFVNCAIIKNSNDDSPCVSLKNIERLKDAVVPVERLDGEWIVMAGGLAENADIEFSID